TIQAGVGNAAGAPAEMRAVMWHTSTRRGSTFSAGPGPRGQVAFGPVRIRMIKPFSPSGRGGRRLRLQQVEPPEVVFDRQDFATGEACLLCIPLDRLGPDHRPRTRRAFADHADRQAVEDAEAVVEPFDFACGRRELLLRALVAVLHHAAVSDEYSLVAK